MLKSKFYLIIPASGIGSRFDGDIPKQYTLMQNGKTILDNTIEVFIKNGNFAKIIIALNESDKFFKDSIFYNNSEIITVIGGKERFLSVKNALDKLTEIADKNDFVCIHDGVRPCIKNADINNLLQKIDAHEIGGLLVSPVVDTLKLSKNGKITTINRNNIFNALTPQCYRAEVLQAALKNVIKNNLTITDDASSIELFGKNGLAVVGDKNNLKITTKDDLKLANSILEIK